MVPASTPFTQTRTKLMFDSLANPKQAAFLTAYSRAGKCLLDVSKSARAAKCERSQHYHWLERDPAYKAAFAQAEKLARDGLIAHAREFAIEGEEELVLYQGVPVMV